MSTRVMTTNATSNAVPPVWEIERRVMEVIHQQTRIPVNQITVESRLVEDLGIDSLDIVELILALEDAFQVSLRDESGSQLFVNRSPTTQLIAQWIVQEWNTGSPTRLDWLGTKEKAATAESLPFTQLSDTLPEEQWCNGQLYEKLGVNREGFQQFLRRTDGMRCTLLPEDEVLIGDDSKQSLPDQQPRDTVRLSSFLLDAEPVSNAAFARFINSVRGVPSSVLAEWCEVDDDSRRASHFQLTRTFKTWKPVSSTEHLPVILVSWYGANAYSLWANRRDWRYYRGDGLIPAELRSITVSATAPEAGCLHSFLPSETQWEYAARGSEARTYPWGEEPPTPARACVAQHSKGAQYRANSLPSVPVSVRLGMSTFGLHHMAGNVWQWCRDWYAPDFYQTPESRQRDPQNIATTGIRNERGSSWVGPVNLARSSYRRGRAPMARGRCLGFRCCGRTEDLPIFS